VEVSDRILKALQIGIVNIYAMHGVAITARTSMDANILALLLRETVKDTVVDVDEGIQESVAGPWVGRIIFQCKTTYFYPC